MARIIENVAGVRLSVHVAGGGTPTLIFVHGGFCNGNDWSAQIRALAPRFGGVTFDMPGHGDSALPTQASVEGLAEAVCGVIANWGGGRAVLVGHSLGVDVILEAYRQSSAGIAGLILIEGGLVADGDPDRAVANFKQGLKAVGFDTFLQSAFGEMFTPRSDPQLRQQVLDRLKNLDEKFAQEIILSKIYWDASQASRVLASVNVPVLLLQSTYFDETFKRRSLEPGMTTPWTELVMRQVPSAQLHCVPAVGHFPQIEAADFVNEHIAAFAERLRTN